MNCKVENHIVTVKVEAKDVISRLSAMIDKISEARKANSELLRQSTPGSIQHRHHETIDDHLFGALALIDGQ